MRCKSHPPLPPPIGRRNEHRAPVPFALKQRGARRRAARSGQLRMAAFAGPAPWRVARCVAESGDAPVCRVGVRPGVRLLASDLDGTLLNSARVIEDGSVEAVLRCMARGVAFVPATGKSRSGAIRAMGALGAHMVRGGPFPGVFLNGLLVFGRGGRLVHEQVLEKSAAVTILDTALDCGLIPLFYAGDRILVEERSASTDMFIVSHEPVPEAVGPLRAVLDACPVHKALLVDPRGDVVRLRAPLAALFGARADITQARPDVLEVLPPGASKGDGFRRLLDDLGVPAESAVAVGDAENDLEMIAMAGVGVAMANAVPAMRSVANATVASNDDGGVADAIERFVLVDLPVE